MIGRINYFRNRIASIAQFSTLNILGKTVRLRHYSSTTSTMDLALKHLDSDIQCFVADEQTNGVGQHSNKWLSLYGNIHMTLSLPISLSHMRLLPAISCISVCYMLESQLSCQSTIKWINDVFIKNRKIAGCLIKSSISDCNIALIGIGINVEKSPPDAICMKYVIDKPYNRMAIVSQTIENIFRNLQLIYEKNDMEVIRKTESRLLYLNQRVRLYDSTLKSIISYGIFKGLTEHYEAIINVNGIDKTFLYGRMRDF